jgi:hypothetical protein
MRVVSPEGEMDQMDPCQPLDEREQFTGALLCPERLRSGITEYQKDGVTSSPGIMQFNPLIEPDIREQLFASSGIIF